MKGIDDIKKTTPVRVNKKNYWLLQLLYGDTACDKTATFQIPDNISFMGNP